MNSELRPWLVATLALIAGTAMVMPACSGKTPTAPTTPQNPPAPAARVVSNAPPTISAVRVSADRVEANGQVQLTAVVSDDDTPLDQLTYEWAASPNGGSFNGSGPQLFWRAPSGAKTPDLYTFNLTATERYKSNGDIQTNTSSGTATVHYNDSPTEVKQVASNFLRDFGDFTKTPQQCVQYFTDTCAAGKNAELADITNNRANFHILSSSFTPTTVSFDTSRTNATVSGPCEFVDIRNASGATRHLSGNCVLTEVYEKFQWWLCTSNFANGQIN